MAVAGTGKVLGDKIAAEIISPDAPPEMRVKIIALWESIGDIIVDHFVENTETFVEPGIPVSTTGTETAQSGETTDKGNGGIL
jgi:hypothetical protein